jgi:hypothetical protein
MAQGLYIELLDYLFRLSRHVYKFRFDLGGLDFHDLMVDDCRFDYTEATVVKLL